MKYAVVEHRGKQYLAEEGRSIEIDRLALESGKKIEFKEVLLVSDGRKIEVGQPFIKGAKVSGLVEDHIKGPKLVVFKFRPKQRYRRKRGHRQSYTRVAIQSIGLPAAAKSEKKTTAPKAKAKPKASAAKAPAKTAAKPSAAKTSKAKAPAKSKSGSTTKGATAAKGRAKPATKSGVKSTSKKTGAAGRTTRTSSKSSPKKSDSTKKSE